MDYRWKIDPSDGDGCRLTGWDVNDDRAEKVIQWETDSEARFAKKKDRYTTRKQGTNVVFKILLIKPTDDRKDVWVRLVDTT